MYNAIINFFTCPIFEDEELYWKTKIFFKIIKGIMLTIILILMQEIAMPRKDLRWFLVVILVEVTGVISLWIARRKKIKLASYILISVLCVLMISLAYTAGGVHSLSYQGGTLLVILITGLLLGRNAGLSVTTIFGLVGVIFLKLEKIGGLPVNEVIQTSLTLYLAQIFYAVTIIALITFAYDELKSSLNRESRKSKERLETERNLFESQKIYASLFHNNPSIIIVSTMEEGKILQTNSEHQRIFGYKEEELIGNTVGKLLMWENYSDRESVKKLLKNNGSVKGIEVNMRKKNGEIFSVLISMNVIEYNGETCIITMGIDNTRRKKAEEEVIMLNQELESRVENRTKELENAYRDLKSYSYTISHDLKVPMRVIYGYCRILIEDYDDMFNDDSREIIKNIRKICNDMINLINKLLDYAMLSNLELDLVTVNLTEMIKEVFTEVNENDIRKIEIIFDTVLPDIITDKQLIKHIIINLLSNAVKYTKNREIAIINIGCKIEESEITYYIKDNGVGFPSIYGHKLFNIFQRLHSNKEFEGSGIGLVAAKKALEKLNGRIYILGETDLGATVYFTLPKINL